MRQSEGSPENRPRELGLSGAVFSEEQRRPKIFPPQFARIWGDDEYGLIAIMKVGEVNQVMRWIEPGTFLMGSREEELKELEV